MAFMVQRMETAAKTDEIMARFRPIAPKPLPAAAPASSSSSGARKRGWQEDYYNILLPSHLGAPVLWPGAGVGSAALGSKERSIPRIPLPLQASHEHLVRLSPALPGASPSEPSPNPQRVIPVERDLLSELQVCKVIAPRPLRPLRTTICIDSSNIAGPKSATAVAVSMKTAKEVEAEVEQYAHPAVVSGCHNRVFLVNDAYKAMVGQPVCPWLDSLPGAGASRRINGEVVMNVQTFSPASRLPIAGGAFPCTARITWELDGAMASLTVPCAVEHLTGNSGVYRSIWRFDSTRASIIYCLA